MATEPTAPDNGWEVVRVRDETGGTYTTTRHLARLAGHEVLEDRPALDNRGNWLPPTPKENLTTEPKRTKGAK